ncbi:MAG: hypothetical protein ACPGOV_00305 [Magnetovibrionaceae bacterium]
MPRLKTRWIAVIVLPIVALLGACETSPPVATQPSLSFAHLGTIPLNVARIETTNRYAPPLAAPNVEHLFQTEPAVALQTWARERLKPVGSSGVARFVVMDASVVEERLKTTEGLKGAFTVDQSERYLAKAEAVLEILDDAGNSLRFASASASQSSTIAEDATLNERETLWFDLTEGLVANFDKTLVGQMQRHLGEFMIKQ